MGLRGSVEELALARAEHAIAQGCHGVVASGFEARAIRRMAGPGPIIVTPGIRPAGASEDDQKRATTPAAAIRAGADYLVVGRPIRDAKDPAAVASGIVREIEHGLIVR
jgi:orotidine-5'-phosphate decarboxylase